MPRVDNPILLNIPTTIETERLSLRVPQPGDGEIVHAAITESQGELEQWLQWAAETQHPQAQEAKLRHATAAFIQRTAFVWLAFRKSDGHFIGRILVHYVDWSVPRFEIGYWVRTTESGHGYITEAVNAVTAFAFQALHAERLAIECDTRNTRSIAVARRCGYTEEGTLRNNLREQDDTLSSGVIFSMLREEWSARHADG